MVKFLFSDQYRLIKFFVVVSLMMLLVWWGTKRAFEYEVTFVEAVKEVQLYAGKEFTFGGRIIEKKGDDVTILDRGMKVRLSLEKVPSMRQVPQGKVVTGRGVLTDQQTIQVTDFHYHRYRDLKVWTSLAVSIVMFLWFWWKFRWDFEKWEFVERGH